MLSMTLREGGSLLGFLRVCYVSFKVTAVLPEGIATFVGLSGEKINAREVF